MLHFFRKYQKFFFLFITIIIVSTFVFYGASQAFAPSGGARGEEESHVTQVARFLNTEEWMASRKVFAANFLNDGVISKEFLETGMADLIAAKYAADFQSDFAARQEKEKSYRAYTHPYLPSLSAEAMWSVFAPDMPAKLKVLQEGNGSFKERNAVFLAQKQFPPPFLSQVIRYQEQNNPHFPPDSRLAKEDIALFGYQNLSDWFGDTFVETVAEIIVQTADVARKLGYKVCQDELLAELVTRSQEAYKGLKQRVDLPVQDGYGLFQLYIRQVGLTEEQTLKIWEDVSLFRRLMHEVGAAALIDPLPLSQFYGYAYENVTVDLYQMAPEVRLKSLEDLKKFETYLAAVGTAKILDLDIPQEYAPLATIESKAPALVGKRYQISLAKSSKKALQAKVSVKETLMWECEPQNWKVLLKQFPELAQKTGAPFDVLEGMDQKGRKQIDAFARKQIVESHPEWIQEALGTAQLEEKELFLSSATKKPLEGIEDAALLVAALETQDELLSYTQDEQTYYRFIVRAKGETKEVLSYKEALKGGILDKLVEPMQAEALSQAIIEASPKAYKELAHAYRFAKFIGRYKENLPQGALAKQFVIEKKETTLTRSEGSFIALDEALALSQGAFSDVKVDPVEGAYLYRFIERKLDTTLPLEKMVQAQELLSKEARCRYFEQLLPHFKV